MRVWLLKKRMLLGLSQKEIAKIANVHQASWSRYERNKKYYPSIKVAKKVALILGFDWTRFYEDDDDFVEDEF